MWYLCVCVFDPFLLFFLLSLHLIWLGNIFVLPTILCTSLLARSASTSWSHYNLRQFIPWFENCSRATVQFYTPRLNDAWKTTRSLTFKECSPGAPIHQNSGKTHTFCFSFKILISYSVPNFLNPQFPWENPHNPGKVLYPISVTLLLRGCCGENGIRWTLRTVFNTSHAICKVVYTIQMLYKSTCIAKFINYESWAKSHCGPQSTSFFSLIK